MDALAQTLNEAIETLKAVPAGSDDTAEYAAYVAASEAFWNAYGTHER